MDAKSFMKLVVGGAALGASAAAAYRATGDYFYRMTIDRNSPKDFIPTSDGPETAPNARIRAIRERTAEIFKSSVQWADELPHADWFIQSGDGLRLAAHAYRAEQETHNWVIFVHGYGMTAKNSGQYARPLYEAGYNLLLPNLRGHGESEGDYIGMGWHDRLDLIRWTEHLADADPHARILLFGLSMGAAAVMMASGEALPQGVCGIIEDCGYTSAYDVFAFQAKRMFHMPVPPILAAASDCCRRRAGYSFREADALRQVARSRTPTLFIHGNRDEFVPFSMLGRLYDAAGCVKEMLIIPGAAHAEASGDTELYWPRVLAFARKYLGE